MAEIMLSAATVGVGQCVNRVDRQGPIATRNRLVRTSQILQYDGTIGVDQRQLRCECNR